MVMICVLAAGLVAALPVERFTLGWSSAEGLAFEEDVRVEAGLLLITQARLAGAGPDFVPPPGATLAEGVWRYAPGLPPFPEIAVEGGPSIASFRLCTAGACRALIEILPAAAAEGATIRPCEG